MTRRWLGLGVLFLALAFTRAAGGSDLSADRTEALIDSLTTLDEPIPGISTRNTFTWFFTDRAPKLNVGIIPADVPEVPPAFRELVGRGLAALPSILSHLDDARPTRIVIPPREPADIFGGIIFSDEYDPRNGRAKFDDLENNRPLRNPYSVTVGDVCFAILGTIVNRALIPVRYQPTAIVIINSTRESPTLVRWARRDWSGLTASALRASLVADIGSDNWWRSDGALQRLRFYYPQAYNSLTGTARAKRDKFEAEEREQLNRDAQQ